MRFSDWSSDVCSSDLTATRLQIDAIGDEFHRVTLRFGFMETPDVPLALMRSCDQGGIHFDPMDTTYFASRENVVAARRGGMPVWRDQLFEVMHRNAAPAPGFFHIPGNRLVELGTQVEICRPNGAMTTARHIASAATRQDTQTDCVSGKRGSGRVIQG